MGLSSHETCHTAYHNQCCCKGTAFHLLRNFQVCVLPITKRQKLYNMSWEERKGPNTCPPISPDLIPHNFFLVSIYSWKNTKLQIFGNMEHCIIVSKALYDRFCRHWSGRWAPTIIRFDNSQVSPMRLRYKGRAWVERATSTLDELMQHITTATKTVNFWNWDACMGCNQSLTGYLSYHVKIYWQKPTKLIFASKFFLLNMCND